MLLDLILDISNELDINVLCHKILVNVGALTQADRYQFMIPLDTLSRVDRIKSLSTWTPLLR